MARTSARALWLAAGVWIVLYALAAWLLGRAELGAGLALAMAFLPAVAPDS